MSAKRVTTFDVVKGKIVKRKGFEREADAQALIAGVTGRAGYILYNDRIWKVRSVQQQYGRSTGRWFHSAAEGHSFSTYDPPATFRKCAARLVSTKRLRLKHAQAQVREYQLELARAVKVRAAGPK